jgi:hypothetical protein
MMPTPLPSIHDQVLEQRRALIRERQAPVEVLFNDAGYTQAMKENEGHFGAVTPAMRPTTYMGFPFRTRPGQLELVMLRGVPGNSEEARQFRASQRDDFASGSRQAADEAIAGNNTARARMLLENEPTLQALGKVITEPQISDLVEAFAGEAVAAGTATPLQRALYEAVTLHGRFE